MGQDLESDLAAVLFTAIVAAELIFVLLQGSSMC